MKFLGDHRSGDGRTGTVHVVNEEIEEQKNSHINPLALPQRLAPLDFIFRPRVSSLSISFENCGAMLTSRLLPIRRMEVDAEWEGDPNYRSRLGALLDRSARQVP